MMLNRVYNFYIFKYSMLENMCMSDETLNLLTKAHQKILMLEEDNDVLRMHVELLEKDHRTLTDLYSETLQKKNKLIKQNQELRQKLQRTKEKLKPLLTGQGENKQNFDVQKYLQNKREFSYSKSISNKSGSRKRYGNLSLMLNCSKLQKSECKDNIDSTKMGEQVKIRTDWKRVELQQRSKSAQSSHKIQILGMDEKTMDNIASQFDETYISEQKLKNNRCKSSLIVKNTSKHGNFRSNIEDEGVGLKKFNYTNWRRLGDNSNLICKGSRVNHKIITINR